jgi:hypothetical protein
MIWKVFRNSLADMWDEMFYVILFNIIWFFGTLLIIPWPLVTFGLFHIAHDIGQGKGIKLSMFWRHLRQTWKQAYIWGGLNLVALLTVWMNVYFYGTIGTEWAGYVQVLFIALFGFWFIWQLIALAFYPRLKEPGFKMATRNAAITIGRYPLLALVFMGMVMLVLALAFMFNILLVVGAMSLLALMSNRLVEAVLKKDQEPETLEDGAI